MNREAASQAYLNASVENAPPVQIIRLLYQGALRFAGQAQALEKGVLDPGFSELLGRVDDIVVELRLSLDYGPDGKLEISRNLERLYLFCEDEIGRVRVERTLEPLDNVKNVLMMLLDAWRKVDVDTGLGQ